MSWTTFILHLERYLHTIYQVCPTSRSGEEDVWNLHSFYPWGPSPWAPLGATCTILSTLDLLPLRMIPTKFGWNLIISFEEKYQNKNFPCSAPPPPACYPHRAPMGPPTEMSWTTFILHLERYLHTIYQVCPTSRSGEEDVWNLHTSSFYPWGPSPWAPLGATCTILATLDLLPLRMIPTKFGWNLTMHFGEEDENVKSLHTTYDGRRRTPDKKRSQ